jgi:hypothetical protein
LSFHTSRVLVSFLLDLLTALVRGEAISKGRMILLHNVFNISAYCEKSLFPVRRVSEESLFSETLLRRVSFPPAVRRVSKESLFSETLLRRVSFPPAVRRVSSL